MSRPETALSALAAVAQTAIRAATGGTGNAYYPEPGSLLGAPNLILFWGDTAITLGNEQFWVVQVKGQLLASALRTKLPTDIARSDPLIVPLVDAFAPGTDGNLLQANNTNRLVEYCRVERVIPSLVIEFPGGSGSFYYGAEVYWGVKIRRFTGDA